jgi:hypothetical protein
MNQKVLLISPGGCACTAFINFLKDHVKQINCKDDSDRLKHTLPWNPLIQQYNPTHIIYLYGDFDKAIRSLFRRNFQDRQYHKLRNIIDNKNIPTPFKNLVISFGSLGVNPCLAIDTSFVVISDNCIFSSVGKINPVGNGSPIFFIPYVMYIFILFFQ